MNITKLIKRLIYLWFKHGDVQVDIITENTDSYQVEQELGDVAYSSSEKRIKLLPVGFL